MKLLMVSDARPPGIDGSGRHVQLLRQGLSRKAGGCWCYDGRPRFTGMRGESLSKELEGGGQLERCADAV